MSKATKEYNLQKANPELAKEWHPFRNGDLTPKDVINYILNSGFDVSKISFYELFDKMITLIINRLITIIELEVSALKEQKEMILKQIITFEKESLALLESHSP